MQKKRDEKLRLKEEKKKAKEEKKEQSVPTPTPAPQTAEIETLDITPSVNTTPVQNIKPIF